MGGSKEHVKYQFKLFNVKKKLNEVEYSVSLNKRNKETSLLILTLGFRFFSIYDV